MKIKIGVAEAYDIRSAEDTDDRALDTSLRARQSNALPELRVSFRHPVSRRVRGRVGTPTPTKEIRHASSTADCARTHLGTPEARSRGKQARSVRDSRSATGVLGELPRVDCDEVVQDHGEHRQHAERVREVVQRRVRDHVWPVRTEQHRTVQARGRSACIRGEGAVRGRERDGPDVVVAANGVVCAYLARLARDELGAGRRRARGRTRLSLSSSFSSSPSYHSPRSPV